MKKQKTRNGLEYWRGKTTSVFLERTTIGNKGVARAWFRNDDDNINRDLIIVPHNVSGRTDKNYIRKARNCVFDFIKRNPRG